MPETRARDLANLAGAGATSSTVAYHETARNFTLPSGAGSQNQVISSNANGTTQWKNTLSAPVITSVTSTKGINRYESATDNGGGTFTVTGTDFGSTTGELTATISSDSSGVTNTVGDISCSSVSGTGGTTAVFTITGAESGFSNWTASLSSSSIYVKVTKAGLASNIVALSGGVNTLSGDPTISSVTGTASSTTVSTTSLGSYGGQVAGGGTDSNTKLLLNFDRGGGTDIEDSSNTGGEGHKVPTNGQTSIKASPFGDGKSAMYFDGGDYLEIADSPVMGSGNYTIDFWINPSSTQNGTPSSSYLWVVEGRGSISEDTGLVVQMHETNFQLRLYNGATGGIPMAASSDTALSSNTWQHVAIVRSGTGSDEAKFYINGHLKATFTDSTTWSATGSDFIGANYNGDHPFTGYIDEFRLVVGEGVFTSDFTPSQYRYGTTGATHEVSTASNMKVLIHSDKEDDASSDKRPVTVTGAIQKTDQSKWGGSSWYFDGTNDLLTIPDSADFNFGSGDFTIEAWVYPQDQDYCLIFNQSNNNDADLFELGLETNGNPKFRFKSGGTTHVTCTASGNPVSDGTWHHLAVVRNGNTFSFYIDGALEASDTSYTGSVPDYTDDFKIGARQSGGTHYSFHKGYIDDFRIVKGLAVYTDTFSVPTGPLTTTGGTYPNSNNRTDPTASQTKLLIHGDGAKFADSATSGTTHTITPTGAYHTQSHGGIVPALPFPASGKATGSAGAYFDGSQDHLLLLDSSTQNDIATAWNTGSWSLDCWLYMTAYPANSNGFTILSTTDGVTYGTDLGYYNATSGGTGYWGWIAGSAFTPQTDQTTDTPTLNTWMHLLFVLSWSGTTMSMKIYKDGKYLGSQGFSGSEASKTLSNYNSVDYMTIGGNAYYSGGGGSWSASNGKNWNGYIDNYRFSTGDVTADSSDPLYTNSQTSTSSNNFVSGLPTQIYGAFRSQDVGTITITGVAGDGGGDVAFTDDYSASSKTQLTAKGLTLTDIGAGNNTATITGTLDGITGTENSIFAVKATANEDSERTTIVGGTNFLGITQNTTSKPVLFNARRYYGNVSNRVINGFGFSPDLVWIKNRDSNYHHGLYDTVRGANKTLLPSDDGVQVSSTDQLNSFLSDGFSLGDNSDSGNYVNLDDAYIAWAWKAGGAPSANGKKKVDGVESSITSGASADYNIITNVKQSINTVGDFSITTYNGQATDGAFFKHGLSGKPDWVIVKRLTTADADWVCWHSGLNSGASGSGDYIMLNGDRAKGHTAGGTSSADNYWGTVSITATQLGLGNGFGAVNDTNHTYVAYCWKVKAEVSKFGTYEGQGNTDISITDQSGALNCGFTPRFLITKNIDFNGSSWEIKDAFRNGANPRDTAIHVDGSGAEGTSTSAYGVNFVTDGFEITGNGTHLNRDGDNYIYIAFA